jgi:hypothetical protein
MKMSLVVSLPVELECSSSSCIHPFVFLDFQVFRGGEFGRTACESCSERQFGPSELSAPTSIPQTQNGSDSGFALTLGIHGSVRENEKCGPSEGELNNWIAKDLGLALVTGSAHTRICTAAARGAHQWHVQPIAAHGKAAVLLAMLLANSCDSIGDDNRTRHTVQNTVTVL